MGTKITFPHMGNMYIPIKVLLDSLDIDYVLPPFCTRGNLDLGISHSPEFACLPFKTILGDILYGLENGAGLVLFGSGCGRCRLGYYGDLLAEILKDLEYKTDFICLELNHMSINDVISKLQPLTGGKSKAEITGGIMAALRTVFLVDGLSELANRTRCREIHKGRTDGVMSRFHLKAQITRGYEEIRALISSGRKELKQIAVDKRYEPLKVSMVGEIYIAAYPHTNVDVERKLGNMGVEVHNNLSVSFWIRNHFLKGLLPVGFKDRAHEEALELIKTEDVGGHGTYTVGCSIMSAKKNFDGVIQLYPFTCMPEIVAQSAFDEIRSRYGIPIMTLVMDEMTGEAGYVTRLEAFVDLLEKRRERRCQGALHKI